MGRFLKYLLLLWVLWISVLPCCAEELAEETTPPQEAQETEAVTTGWGLYFGLLHSHSSLSDGTESVEEVFRQAAATEGLDFFAVTDNSDSFAGGDAASLASDASAVSQDWAAGKAAAKAVTDSGFVGIFGYEMNWDNGLGHMATFCTPGFQHWQQEAYSDYRTGLQNYYETLTCVPEAISQFNHPGRLFGDFRDFDFYSEIFDRNITLLEVGSRDQPNAYEYYDRALEKGWHVAPTNNNADDNCRSVVYAHSLTEEGIYDALRNYRVYATEDGDLSIYYSLDGHFMGAQLKKWHIGDTADILVTLSDPTDAIGIVEVISRGGVVLARETVESQWATVNFALSPDEDYYYIRVTQPDGDVAVTSPIWVETEESAGISAFSCGTSLPVQGQTADFSLELFNHEAAQLTVQKIDLFADGEPVQTLEEAYTLWQGGTCSVPIRLPCDAVGVTRVDVCVTARLGDAQRCYSASFTLRVRMPDMVRSLLVDHTHGNSESYAQLAALAVENNISVTAETAAITAEMLKNSSILLIPGVKTAFSDDYLALVGEYLSLGGSLILWGGNEAESNRLLEAVGSTLRFREGSGEILHLTDWNSASPWCANLQPGQLFSCSGSLDRGSGSWIVENALAVEETAFGGRIFAGSGRWLSDEALTLPKNIWDLPSANTTIIKNILGSTEATLPLHSIAHVRTGTPGQIYRIRGYVTAGTSNPYNTFENAFYLQDETGGIGVIPLEYQKLSVGTAVEIVGCLSMQGKNPVLEPISVEVLDAAMYRYLPLTGSFQELMDNSLHGGRLVQVEGKVVTFRYGADGRISQLVLESGGSYATVQIEDNIFSGATGINDLASQVEVGRHFRAIGIVHMNSDGVSVVRVRNCDEVVYVPLLTYYWEPCQPDNPRVGDSIGLWLVFLAISTCLLIPLRRKLWIM